MSPFSLPNHPLFRAAVVFSKTPRQLFEFIKLFFLAIAVVLAIWAIGETSPFLLGLGIASFAIFIASALWLRFITFYRGEGLIPLPANQENASWLDFQNQWILSVDFAMAGVLSRISDRSDPLAFLEAYFTSDIGAFFSLRTNIPLSDTMTELKNGYEQSGQMHFDLARIAAEAARAAIKNHHHFITPADFFIAIAASEPVVANFLIRRGLDGKDFDYLAHWIEIASEHRRKSFLERLTSATGIGKTWAYAFTPFLDRMSRPITRGRDDELHILAHRATTRELEEALARSSAANALIVGDPGVGKMTVVKGLVQNLDQGRSFTSLNFRRVRELAMEEIVAAPAFGTIEATLNRIFGEAERAGNIILVIQDLENYFSHASPTHVAEGILPFLHSPLIKIIGLMTPEGYARTTADYPVLKNVFHEIRIEEPSEETMMEILEDATTEQEHRSGLIASYPAIRAIYELGARYIPATPFPEKGITLLEEVFVATAAASERIITREIVEEVVSRKVGSMVSSAGSMEGALLLKLEEKIHARVVNQEPAIKAIADAVRRKRAGVSTAAKPAGSFLFLGPTGVGKTETAKALASAYFGSADKMIRLDMSEYQNPRDITRLIGSTEAHEPGFLAREIRANPFSLILLDEVEKAHPNILDLFLQILDEGHANDAYDKKIDFTNAIIVATSNAGAEFIRQSLNQGLAYPELQARLIDEVLKRGIFRPEFLNRFDAAVVYTPLSLEHVKKVAELMLADLAKRIEQQGFHLAWDAGLVQWLAERGYSQIFGGRELRRVMQDTIESNIANEILSGRHPKGSTISISMPAKTPEPPAPPTGLPMEENSLI